MPLWEPFQRPALPVQLFLTLYKTNAVLVRRLEERLAPLHLTLGRLCLLVALRQAGHPLLPSEIGDDLAVTRSNVSGLLNALEPLGFVRREIDVTDRRRMLVHLTPEGEAVLAQSWPIYVEAVSGGLSPLSPEEQATLLQLLRKISGP